MGYIIYMFRELGGRHHFPHIHAQYNGQKAVFNIETVSLLEGNLPKMQQRLVEAWIELRKDQLRLNWSRLNLANGTPSFTKIEPLK